jgi:TPP-dependent indolepyruvate ferredoxin oxidoreductase alpha subunit
MNVVHIAIGAVIGGALGFTYYKIVGCATGACPLTSNPFVTTIYGTCVGGLIASAFC